MNDISAARTLLDSSAETSADPITMDLVRGAMKSIQNEMEALIERTAMSAFIREKKDFYAGLFDACGRFLAGKSRPGSSDLITPILREFPADTIRPGDLFWYNDCYAAGGAVSHSPDQVLAAPVFHRGELVAFSQAWAHFSDIGGMHAGSISPNCTEIFQEGMIVPVVRLAVEGRVADDLLRMFLRNSRFPDAVGGDMRALMAAVRLGERRMEDLIERFGVSTMRTIFDALIDRVRRVLQQRFRALVPNGTYRFVDTVDSDGHGSAPIKLKWTLEVTPERIVLDATESGDQVRGPVNYLMSLTEPAMTFGSFLLGDSKEYTLNAGAEGLFDELRVREGSILQPRFPAPLGQRSITKMRNLSAYLGLLGVATGGKMPAAHTGYVIWNVRGENAQGPMAWPSATARAPRRMATTRSIWWHRKIIPPNSSKPPTPCVCATTRSTAIRAAQDAGAVAAAWCARWKCSAIRRWSRCASRVTPTRPGVWRADAVLVPVAASSIRAGRMNACCRRCPTATRSSAATWCALKPAAAAAGAIRTTASPSVCWPMSSAVLSAAHRLSATTA